MTISVSPEVLFRITTKETGVSTESAMKEANKVAFNFGLKAIFPNLNNTPKAFSDVQKAQGVVSSEEQEDSLNTPIAPALPFDPQEASLKISNAAHQILRIKDSPKDPGLRKEYRKTSNQLTVFHSENSSKIIKQLQSSIRTVPAPGSVRTSSANLLFAFALSLDPGNFQARLALVNNIRDGIGVTEVDKRDATANIFVWTAPEMTEDVRPYIRDAWNTILATTPQIKF